MLHFTVRCNNGTCTHAMQCMLTRTREHIQSITVRRSMASSSSLPVRFTKITLAHALIENRTPARDDVDARADTAATDFLVV